jgi:hypothetical protein
VWIATGVKIQVDNKDSGLADQFQVRENAPQLA